MRHLLAQAPPPVVPTPTIPSTSLPNQTFWDRAVPNILPACAQQDGGCDSLEDLMQLFVNISEVVLGLTGIVLLGVFVYAGFIYVTSNGEAERISKAHKMWQSTLVGLAIIFFAYAVISYGVASLISNTVKEQPVGSYVTICDGDTSTEGRACGPNAKCQQGVCRAF